MTGLLRQPRPFDGPEDERAWKQFASGWAYGLTVRDPETRRKVTIDTVDHGLRIVNVRISGGRPQQMMPLEFAERYGDLLQAKAEKEDAANA